MSPHSPLSPDEIAQHPIDAADAGAAILHLHARDPKDGRPTAERDVFAQFLPVIRSKTSAVINITSGGSTKMTLKERFAPPLRFRSEMASLNSGSMNFSIHPEARAMHQLKSSDAVSF